MKAVIKLNDETRNKDLYIVPETDLEERFFIWFNFQYGIPRQRINNKESLQFPGSNDSEQTIENLEQAFAKYKIRFRYREIPNVIGISLSKASKKLKEYGVNWAVEKETFSAGFPPGYVIFQKPRAGSVSMPDSVVYLTVSLGVD